MYDAKLDRVQMLVITGSMHTRNLGTDYFQEMDPVSLYSDGSVFNRFVTEAEQWPFVIDNAIRTAYRENGVAIIHVPVDVGYTEIDDNYISSANAFEKAYPQHRAVDIDKAEHLIQEAKCPEPIMKAVNETANDDARIHDPVKI